MSKKKIFKEDKRDFSKEIHNLMRKDAIEEKNKKKAWVLTKTHRTTPVDEEITYDGVTKESNIPAADEWDENWKTFQDTYKGKKTKKIRTKDICNNV